MKLIGLLLTTIVFLGDSNIWLGGDDCSKDTSWSYWLVDAYKRSEGCDSLSVRSFARSGATLTNTSLTSIDTTHYSQLLNDTNTLYNQALRLNGAVERGELASPDRIFIYGGSNDAWFADRRPGLFDELSSSAAAEINSRTLPGEASSLRSSLRLVITLLQNVNPKSELIFVGPPLMTKTTSERLHRVADIMEETADSEGLKMIRLDSDSLIDPKTEGRKFTLTRDGVHTNPAGARKLATYIFNSL